MHVSSSALRLLRLASIVKETRCSLKALIIDLVILGIIELATTIHRHSIWIQRTLEFLLINSPSIVSNIVTCLFAVTLLLSITCVMLAFVTEYFPFIIRISWSAGSHKGVFVGQRHQSSQNLRIHLLGLQSQLHTSLFPDHMSHSS